MSIALELRKITKRIGDTEILRGVDLSVHRGERHALIGPNGAGKSTLFDLIAGRGKPTSGQVLLDGRDITAMAPHRLCKKGIARSFQLTSVFGGLTVFDNLRCAVLGFPKGSIMDRWVRSAALDAETERLLESIGLSMCRDALAASLSYAEQRALDLGIALATRADLLLLDEPTAGMNRAEAERALTLIRATTEGKTLLIVEHDMQAVFALADRVSVLVHGRVIATGSVSEIQADARVREAYLGDIR